MTDTTINPDAVWVSDMAAELAASTGGDYLAQVSAAKTILSELVFAIHAGELPVYVLGVAGMVERPARNQEAGFPYGDYRLRRATAQAWIASQSTIPALPVVAASDGPAPLRTVTHSTKTRRDTLTPVIELAQSQCRNSTDTAEVWAALLVLAERKNPPLIGATEDGLQYLKNGNAAIFNRDSLRKRLDR